MSLQQGPCGALHVHISEWGCLSWFLDNRVTKEPDKRMHRAQKHRLLCSNKTRKTHTTSVSAPGSHENAVMMFLVTRTWDWEVGGNLNNIPHVEGWLSFISCWPPEWNPTLTAAGLCPGSLNWSCRLLPLPASFLPLGGLWRGSCLSDWLPLPPPTLLHLVDCPLPYKMWQSPAPDREAGAAASSLHGPSAWLELFYPSFTRPLVP